MSKSWSNQPLMREVAEKAIERYARGLLKVDELVILVMKENQQNGEEESEQEERVFKRLALRFCSQALCEGCLSSEPAIRERAFENLWSYLEGVLARITSRTETGALTSDVIQQTMVEILGSFRRRGAGPDRTESFLKWARVILVRQLSLYRRREYREDWSSLDMQPESVLEEIVDWKMLDPLQRVINEESRTELHSAVASLKNPYYRRVLASTYFAERGERELAEDWQVRVQDIYLWRFRALKALRKQPRVVRE